MKKEKKVLIRSVLNQLTQRDLWWKDKHVKFRELYNAWRQEELRQRKHSAPFYTNSWQRGWLPKADFERFRAYAME